MSLRRLARIAMHTLLLIAVAAPTFAGVGRMIAESMRHESMPRESMRLANTATTTGHDAAGEHETPAPRRPCHDEQTAPTAADGADTNPGQNPHEHLPVKIADHGCGDGECAGHVCDMSACHGTACLPRFASLGAPTPTTSAFPNLRPAPPRAFIDSPLRPPIA